MSLVVKLEDDLGERSEWVMLHGVIPANDERDFPVLRCIDPFGKTVFNHLQMSVFLAEWERDLLTIVDEEAKWHLPTMETKIPSSGQARLKSSALVRHSRLRRRAYAQVQRRSSERRLRQEEAGTTRCPASRALVSRTPTTAGLTATSTQALLSLLAALFLQTQRAGSTRRTPVFGSDGRQQLGRLLEG